MKLGDVLKKEREMAGVSAAAMADKLGLSESDYYEIESGGSEQFEKAARLVLGFAKVVGGPGVNRLYYPCGLPFTEVDDYEYRLVR